MAEESKSVESSSKNEFNFLENFVRRLICQLTDMEERKRAANWLKFLKENQQDPLTVHYLLILMLALSRKRLVRPFDVQPPTSISPIGKLKLRGMCRFLIEQYKNMPNVNEKKNGIQISYSSDLKQYGCVQALGDSGMHCYCAFSSNPVTSWDNAGHLKEYSLKNHDSTDENHTSAVDEQLRGSFLKADSCKDDQTESFLHYIGGLKKFRMPFIGRVHVRGAANNLPRNSPAPNT